MREYNDLVTILSIVTVLFGMLKVLCGAGLSIGLVFYFPQLKDLFDKLEEVDPATIQSAFLGVILIILFLVILPGILQVIGGVGVWKRWNWARMLLIVLGGLDAFLALPNLVGGNLIGFVLSGGWGVFALYVLLSDPYRREFLSGPEQ